MKRAFALLAVLGLAFAAALADDPAPAPAGINPALVPVRRDWKGQFQANLDRARQGPVDLLFEGDSITDYWRGQPSWKERYGALNAADFGIASDRIEHVLWRVENGELEGISPKLIVLLIGTNNNGESAGQIADGIALLLREIERRSPASHILLLGIFPRNPSPQAPIRAKIAEANRLLSDLDDGNRVTYLDIGPRFLAPDGSLNPEIMPDGVHPSEKGYRIWADAIQPVIDRYFPPAPKAP